jgi:transposase-like protein
MKEVKHYSDHFKRRVVNEILEGDQSLEYYRRKYKIGGSMTLSRWIDKFAAETAINPSDMSKQQRESDEIGRLKAELALLKRELDDERLRRQAYELMIKIAEEEFNIPIEKKSGVKRSKK